MRGHAAQTSRKNYPIITCHKEHGPPSTVSASAPIVPMEVFTYVKKQLRSLRKSQAFRHWLAASQAAMAEVKLMLFLS